MWQLRQESKCCHANVKHCKQQLSYGFLKPSQQKREAKETQ